MTLTVTAIDTKAEFFRKEIKNLKIEVFKFKNQVGIDRNVGFVDHPITGDQFNEAMANFTLAYRHLEDARMRLGLVRQACQGGDSIYDEKNEAILEEQCENACYETDDQS